LLFLLSEPTSGLDSTAALDLIQVLARIASHSSLTVATVIHQPRAEIFAALDNLLLLAPGGKTVFLGPAKLAAAYFRSQFGLEFRPGDNPADILMDFIAENGENSAENWAHGGEKALQGIIEAEESAELQRSRSGAVIDKNVPQNEHKINNFSAPNNNSFSVGHTHIENGSSIALGTYNYKELSDFSGFQPRSRASWLRQLILSHNRSLIQQYSELPTLLIEVGVAMLAAAVMGFASGGEGATYQGVFLSPLVLFSPSPREILPQIAMYECFAVSLAAASAGVRVFGAERTIYWRETAAGHSLSAYYVGKSLSLLYRYIYGSLHFCMIFMLLARPAISFGKLFLLVYLLFFSVYAVAAVVSMFVAPSSAALVAVVLTLLQSVFNGYINTIPKPLKFISPQYFFSEAYFNEQSYDYRQTMQVHDISAKFWGYELDNFSNDVLLMLTLGVSYRVIAYLGIRFHNRNKLK
jgi:hypothetical protein